MLSGVVGKQTIEFIGMDIYLAPGRVYMKAGSIFKEWGKLQ
jgi:hypothetical protein